MTAVINQTVKSLEDKLRIDSGEVLIGINTIALNTDKTPQPLFEMCNKYKTQLEEFGELHTDTLKKTLTFSKGGEKLYLKQLKTYLLNENQSMLLISFMRNNEIVVDFKVALIKAFSEMKEKLSKKDQPRSLLPINYIEALKALVISEEQKVQITLERDIAIATKAEIGNKREATAMATASKAVRKANQLEIELDQSKEYCTLKRMSMLCHGIKLEWRLLRTVGKTMGIDTIKVFDANYGSVLGYHKDVWFEAYGLRF